MSSGILHRICTNQYALHCYLLWCNLYNVLKIMLNQCHKKSIKFTSKAVSLNPACYNSRLKELREILLSFNYYPRFVCDLVTKWRNVHVPPLALCPLVTLKDDRVTTFYTPWTTPSVTIGRNSSPHARIRLRMPMVPNSEAKILNI